MKTVSHAKNILDQIVEKRRESIAHRKRVLPDVALKIAVEKGDPPRDFAAALSRDAYNVIAEMKKASPSLGLIREDYAPATLAAEVESAGAAALSVLTEEDFFSGSLADLKAARKVTQIPVLRKDFIIDPWQLYESKLLRADAVLLIAALLPEPRELKRMIVAANNLSLTPLVEVHTADELKRALRAEAEYIGINNRNLATFKVDLKVTEKLVKLVPEEKFVVSESGIASAEAAEALWKQGVRGVLIGEALIKAKDTGALAARISAIGKIG